MKVWVLLMVTGALTLAACGQAPPPPPSAVITVEPEFIVAGARTELTFDASKSTARLTLVPAGPNPDDELLEYRWEFSGGVQTAPRDLSAVRVRVVARGDRPVHATLSVTNPQGGEVSALKSVPLEGQEVSLKGL